MVTPELHRTGGTERGTAELVTRLARDHEVCLFAHQWEPDGVPLCFHKVPVLPWPGLARFLSFYLAASRAVDLASREHGGYSAVYSPGPNCRQVQVSTAWFCQARQLELFRAGKHRPPPVTLVDWLKLANRWSYAWCVTKVERAFYRLPQLRRVMAVSDLLARDLQRYYGVPLENVHVAHSGVNSEVFTPERRAMLREQARRELGVAPNQFVYFFIGNNWLIKGLYHVIQTMPQVPDVHLMVVGLGAERPESWQAFARELGVEHRITYLPRRPDVIYYYAAADALLAPSVYDTFGLMPLEAAACGVPSVITRSMGVAEVLTSEEAIILESGEDVPALAQAMRLLQEDPASRERLSRAGIARARRYSWDGMCDATIEILLRTARGERGAELERAPFAA